MNKNDLSKKLSERSNIPVSAARVIVNSIFDLMKETLEKGEGIEIRGFGSFVVRNYGAYKGRNPKTGKIVDVRPKKTLSLQEWERIQRESEQNKGYSRVDFRQEKNMLMAESAIFDLTSWALF
jgi:integration host factor subunit beta